MLNPNDVLAATSSLVYRDVSVHQLTAFCQLSILVPVLTDAASFDKLKSLEVSRLSYLFDRPLLTKALQGPIDDFRVSIDLDRVKSL